MPSGCDLLLSVKKDFNFIVYPNIYLSYKQNYSPI